MALKLQMLAYLGKLEWAVGVLKQTYSIEKAHHELAGDTKAAGESINQLVVVGATLFIGIIVIAQIGEAMPDGEGMMFEDAMAQAETILGSSFTLAALLPLVIIAGALLWYVRNFNSSRASRR